MIRFNTKMFDQTLRSIAVVDVGFTNTKVVQFNPSGKVIGGRKVASFHRVGKVYREIDVEPSISFCQHALRDLDAETPIDVIVPCAHGAAIACLNAGGYLAFPIMDYTSEPPADLVAAYRLIEPPFSEVYGPLLPMALTHGLQLYWQSKAYPQEFRGITKILPLIQYVAYRLSGVAVSEISGLSCQSHLMNINTGEPSSLAIAQGWAQHYAPRAKAWETIGKLQPSIAGADFRGGGRVLAGVHDSNANYLRYLAAGCQNFTLLSSGTWIIGFDTDAKINRLDHTLDTVTNTDVFGRAVACCRFFGGQEFAIVAKGSDGALATVDALQELIERKVFALPSFTDSGGPMPGSGAGGRIIGPMMETPAHRASLASLYCALMVDQSLNAIQSKSAIIVDGPFAKNHLFLAVLAALRPQQSISASTLSEGTTAGAACLGLMPNGKLPDLPLILSAIPPIEANGLADYARHWLRLSTSSKL